MATLGNIIEEPIFLDFMATGDTGAEEAKKLVKEGFVVGRRARSCLSSRKIDGYNRGHILPAGIHRVVILPGPLLFKRRKVMDASQIIFAAIKREYHQPQAGVMPYVRRLISDGQMRELGLWFIAALHEPIRDFENRLQVLSASCLGEGDKFEGFDGLEWQPDGAFVFEVL